MSTPSSSDLPSKWRVRGTTVMERVRASWGGRSEVESVTIATLRSVTGEVRQAVDPSRAGAPCSGADQGHCAQAGRVAAKLTLGANEEAEAEGDHHADGELDLAGYGRCTSPGRGDLRACPGRRVRPWHPAHQEARGGPGCSRSL